MRLIIVANKAPYTIKKLDNAVQLERSTGGLVTALDPIMRKNKGIWICSGENNYEKYKFKLPYNIKQVRLTQKDKLHYYEGYCNRQIWPLFHYFPIKYKLEDKEWEYYKQVNQRFANQIIEVIKPSDKIWIHDYHLMLVPQMLREQGIKNKIGFFLHTPFPNWEFFRILPRRNSIMEGLLSSDLIGFHTISYQRHFLECVKNEIDKNIPIENDVISYKNRKIKTTILPISIDFNMINEKARSKHIAEKSQRLSENFITDIVGLGVDRLDYSKGIVERLEGYEHFLDINPEYQGKITFIQVAVPTRTNIQEYKKIKREVDEAVGRINGKFSKDGWVPVCYIYNTLDTDELVAYYSCADFMLVSALRDGLNLVSKEYIASRVNNNGTLILSEFAGAAEELDTDNKINPYDVKSISNAILKAVNTPIKDKQETMLKLREHVKTNDIYKWVNDFLCLF